MTRETTRALESAYAALCRESQYSTDPRFAVQLRALGDEILLTLDMAFPVASDEDEAA